ncbi:MAG: acetoacetyl-CoA reductase [Myxococcota bacterium]
MVSGGDYSGLTALVTGGAKRLGGEISLHLARGGARTLVHYHLSEKEAKRLLTIARKEGLNIELFRADLSGKEEVFKLADEVIKKELKLDILVLNAAKYAEIKFADTEYAEAEEFIRLNLFAPYFLVQRLAPFISASPNGVVVAMGDIAGIQAWRNHSAYSVAKSALMHLVRVLAVELAPKIRVNGVAPGMVIPHGSISKKRLELLRARIPLKRFASVADILKTIDFIVANESLTGQVIVVDGGRSVATG